MNKNQICKNNEKYKSLQNKKKPSERVGYDDINRQYLRFSEIKTFIGKQSGSILDVGCGNAEFYKFLKMTGFEGKYTGIDVNKSLLFEAKKRFPDGKFLKTDVLGFRGRKYDYVVASGIFNYDYGQNISLVNKMLEKMYSMARRKAIFNGICSQGTRRDKGTFYIDQWKISKWVEKKFGSMVEIRSGFLQFNFTISMSRRTT